MKKVFKEDSKEYKLWSEIINDIYLEFDTTDDASKADDLTNKIEKLIDLISLPVEAVVGKPQCSWVENEIRCKEKAEHHIQGSLINLCDKHNKILNDDIDALFD